MREDLVIGVSISDLDDPIIADIIKKINQFAETNAINLVTTDAQGSARLQKSQIQEINQADIDILVLIPVEGANLTASLKQVKQRNRPIINLLHRVDWPCIDLIDTFIGFEPGDDAELAAIMFNDQLANSHSSRKQFCYLKDTQIEESQGNIIGIDNASQNIFSDKLIELMYPKTDLILSLKPDMTLLQKIDLILSSQKVLGVFLADNRAKHEFLSSYQVYPLHQVAVITVELPSFKAQLWENKAVIGCITVDTEWICEMTLKSIQEISKGQKVPMLQQAIFSQVYRP